MTDQPKTDTETVDDISKDAGLIGPPATIVIKTFDQHGRLISEDRMPWDHHGYVTRLHPNFTVVMQ